MATPRTFGARDNYFGGAVTVGYSTTRLLACHHRLDGVGMLITGQLMSDLAVHGQRRRSTSPSPSPSTTTATLTLPRRLLGSQPVIFTVVMY